MLDEVAVGVEDKRDANNDDQQGSELGEEIVGVGAKKGAI